jgi:hypothetical protein
MVTPSREITQLTFTPGLAVVELVKISACVVALDRRKIDADELVDPDE